MASLDRLLHARPALEVGVRRLVRRRSGPRARRPRSTCWRRSSGPPSRARGWPRRRTRRRGPWRPRRRLCAIRPRIRSFARDAAPGLARRSVTRIAVRALLRQRLRGQHVLDLARADAEGERAEGAVRRGVRVAADDRHAGLRDAELGPDHVDDALTAVPEAVVRDAELLDVARRARRAAGGRPRPRSGARAPTSARCGRPSRSCGRDAARAGPRAAAPRTPAGS